MSTEQHVITYPGFAEGKDAKGLYKDIENRYGDRYKFHILPFYEEVGADRIVHSIDEHASILQEYMDGLDGEITILGKCGGTRVVASMDDEHIARARKIALINMPWGNTTRTKLEGLFRGWHGHELSDGAWYIPRPGAGGYVVENGYLESTDLNMVQRARQIANLSQLFIVRGMDDEMIRPPVRIEDIPGAIPIDIEGGDHHLLGESRQRAIGAMALILQNKNES